MARRFSGISLAKWHGVGSILHYIVAGGPLVNGDMYLPADVMLRKGTLLILKREYEEYNMSDYDTLKKTL